MSIKKWVIMGVVYVAAVFIVFTLVTGQNPFSSGDMEHDEAHSEMDHGGNDDHGDMEHSAEEMSSTGDVPDGLTEADNPDFQVGSKAVISAEHMPGMDGAEAEISGAFDTTVYSVSYTAEDGTEITDHKWVIHEELENPGNAPLDPGSEVVLNAGHMEGMEGSEAVIDSAQNTTVYMVDFETTDTGESVKYHKWVTEEELSPAD